MFNIKVERSEARLAWTISVTEQETEDHESGPRILGFCTKRTVILESLSLHSNELQKPNSYVEDIQFQEAVAYFEEKGWEIRMYGTMSDGGRIVHMERRKKPTNAV